MALFAGDLNQRIEIMEWVPGPVAKGVETGEWVSLGRYWSSLKPVVNQEVSVDPQVVTKPYWRVRMRRCSTAITPAHKVIYKGRTFNIMEVVDLDTEGEYQLKVMES